MALATPILASADLDRLNCQSSSHSQRIGTFCSSIDEALHGGIESGHITCISGDRGTGKTTIALHLLISHLLSNTTSEVGLLDTTGTFDVLRLHAAILSRIKSNAKESNSDERVEAILQRVKIIRVFDFIGVVESVNEIASTLESRPAATPPPKYNTVAAHKAREIPDSEDENSDEGKDTPPERTPEGQSDSAETRKMEMLIIDNITSAISPVFKSNHIQAHSILVDFLRSLSSLTRSHNLAAIILNSVIISRTNSSANLSGPPVPIRTPGQEEATRHPEDWDFPSIFMSNTVRPALGKIFTYFLDLHILLSMLPKSRRDAELIYGDREGFRRKGHSVIKPQLVNVCEIITDRLGRRGGRWGIFAVEGGCRLSNEC